MMDLVLIYQWTIVAGVIAAPALAILGSHLATRDRAMQTMCVGQGAMVGVLLGIGLLGSYDRSPLGLLGAVAVSIATYLVTDKLTANRSASRNTTFAFVFAVLLATAALVTALFPALESHMAQVYFGDLATLTTFDSVVTAVVGSICLLLLVVRSHALADHSFEAAIFGGVVDAKGRRGGEILFTLLSLVMLCLSVQFVGFLFTIGMLFLPTALMNFIATKGLKLHLSLIGVLAAISTLAGFLLSLGYTRLPTVPTILVVMFGLSLIGIGVERLILFALARDTILGVGKSLTEQRSR